ncbi:MAG: hypothetical protein AAFW89_02325 [Bacteroidota bacterium]
MAEALSIFFKGVVVLFTIASTLLAGYSFQNKLRLRKVRVSWRAGKLSGYPLFATVFLVFILLIAGIGYVKGDALRYGLLLCYSWIGSMWFISSYLASKHYITDYGIVKNINEPAQTIPWFQILDFVEQEKQEGSEFTFTYADPDQPVTSGLNQLRITVPHRKRSDFLRLVEVKLKARIGNYGTRFVDVKNIPNK